ncbi:Probable low-specificity L-threonine aldolase 2 [Geodia barretti]|uniref:Probable low-specificity L-threonine aldolase 2 n=1 Tax=Geodia barretti TaxID=519541 RepID=A0AA35T6I1_GEOBA|nr:Probable low-specificity L-threonine aldolase 2 [Geodia barretti]
MRRAMAEAELGDDVFGDDPTLNRLEAMAAERLGKEAAVFVASGTMGNLVSILTHAGRGDEIIIGDKAHIFRSEAGGASALGGVAYNTLPNDHRGMLDLDELEAAIKPAQRPLHPYRDDRLREYSQRLWRRALDRRRYGGSRRNRPPARRPPAR